MMYALARLFAVTSIVALASGCIDEARCDAAMDGIARARREAVQRDLQIAWLGWQQAQIAAAVVDGGTRVTSDPERDAMQRRIAALEAENASLMVRLGRAERELAAPRGSLSRRRLDEAVPYDRVAVRPSDDDGLVRRGMLPSARTLDEAVPYELQAEHRAAPLTTLRASKPPSKRTLDESVPY